MYNRLELIRTLKALEGFETIGFSKVLKNYVFHLFSNGFEGLEPPSFEIMDF